VRGRSLAGRAVGTAHAVFITSDVQPPARCLTNAENDATTGRGMLNIGLFISSFSNCAPGGSATFVSRSGKGLATETVVVATLVESGRTLPAAAGLEPAEQSIVVPTFNESANVGELVAR
jgi:hypothetical protein